MGKVPQQTTELLKRLCTDYRPTDSKIAVFMLFLVIRVGENLVIPYFFGYKTEFFFSFKNNQKNLDLSYKMDLDLLDSFGSVKLVL